MINQIGSVKSMNGLYKTSETKMATDNKLKNNINDTVTIKNETVHYSSYTKEGTLSVEPDDQYSQLRNIVSSLLKEQGMTMAEAIDGKAYTIDEETQEEAAELTADDGYWGVEQTSDRIFQFAVKSAGNDASKLEEIIAAIDNGFEMALDSFGGTLPEISHNTYDAVMEKLDAWANDTGEQTEKAVTEDI